MLENHRFYSYFQHQAELIAQADDATVTIVRIDGIDRPSCLFQYESDDGAIYQGWLRDGESLADINWRNT